MADRLAPEGVARLDRKRVQRPEVRLDEAEQRPPSGDRGGCRRDHDDRRAELGGLRQAAGGFADPGRQKQRREAEQDRGREDLKGPDDGELRQTDLAEETAGDGEERSLLGG